MKTRITILCALASLALISFTFLRDDFSIGDEAPLSDKQLENIDGTKLSLKSVAKENGVLVVFTCNTCPFVVGSDNFPGWERTYNDLHKSASEAGVGMILVNSNEAKRDGDDSMAEMQAHAKDKAYTMPYVVDAGSALANSFGAKTTPHVYLLDSKMRLTYCGSIDNTWDSKRTADINYLANALEAVKKNQKIEISTSEPRGCSIKRVK